MEKNCSPDPTQLRDTPPLSSSRILFYDTKRKKEGKERREEKKKKNSNTFLSNFSNYRGEESIVFRDESSEEKRAKPRESKPIR